MAVGTAADALAALASATFDCMVLDLSLPDRSGLELLEEMSKTERYAFPPVIVYTGRSLSRAEEQELRKLSNSIIIKGARSPERLLDEVTLFLHQVESELPADRQRMLKDARHREAVFEGRRVLVVEDDVRNIFALSSVLEPRGAKVEIARNGKEALEHLRQSPGVDLMLMDVMMPEMDGLEATRLIRRLPEHAAVAHHRTHRQGDAGRPRPVPGGGRQRLHRQAARRRQAALAGAGLDAQMIDKTATDSNGDDAHEDRQLVQLLDAVFRKYHYDFRGYAAASLKRRVRAALIQLRCESVAALEERMLEDPKMFTGLLRYLTVQVSDLFRDPEYFRAIRERIVPYLETYPSLKVWVAGCATGEEAYSLAILLAEEGLLDRTLIYATDINPESLRTAEAGIYDVDRFSRFSENYLAAGGKGSLSDYYTARYASGVARPAPQEVDPLLRPQPGDRQRVRRGPPGLLPQRAHLLRPRAAGTRDWGSPRVALPSRFPGARQQRVLAIFPPRASLS